MSLFSVPGDYQLGTYAIELNTIKELEKTMYTLRPEFVFNTHLNLPFLIQWKTAKFFFILLFLVLNEHFLIYWFFS